MFFEELEARAAELSGVTITRLDSDTGARLDAAKIGDDVGGSLGEWSYYFCGPKPMIAAVSNGLTKRGVSARRIHKEEFG